MDKTQHAWSTFGSYHVEKVHAHVGRSTQVKSVRISELMVWNHFLEVEKEKEIEIKVEIKMEIERNREILCKQTD
jgi:hypothetical protein